MIRGFTCGTFDFLHAGHIFMLKQAKKQCDYLIVGLKVDPTIDKIEKNKPIETLIERTIKLLGCHYVDEVFAYEKEEDLQILMGYYSIDKRFMGEDYSNRLEDISFPELVPIIFTKFIPPTSSDLRKRVKK